MKIVNTNNIAKQVIIERKVELRKNFEEVKDRVIQDLIKTGQAQTRTSEIADLFRDNDCFTIREAYFLGKKVFQINIVSLDTNG